MSDREHFIATLQACYFGDRNAFDEIVRIYDKKENIIKEVREYIEEHSQMTDLQIYGIENVLSFRGSVEELLEILDKENK